MGLFQYVEANAAVVMPVLAIGAAVLLGVSALGALARRSRRSRGDRVGMTEDEIVSVEIAQDGKLCVTPASQDFAYIYRAAMEVGWDPVRRCLFAPKPREATYPTWFRQIIAAAADEYGVRLNLTPQTAWINVPDAVRSEIAARPR